MLIAAPMVLLLLLHPPITKCMCIRLPLLVHFNLCNLKGAEMRIMTHVHTIKLNL